MLKAFPRKAGRVGISACPDRQLMLVMASGNGVPKAFLIQAESEGLIPVVQMR